MKNLLSLSIILLAGTGSALGDNILISPASQTVSLGQTFTLDINVDQIPDLFDYQFSLSFDPAVLAAQSVTEGTLFANTGDSFFSPGSINNTAGSITTTDDTLEGKVHGVSGPGTLAIVQFTAIAAAGRAGSQKSPGSALATLRLRARKSPVSHTGPGHIGDDLR
jgi:general secretion pathway protein D